MTGQKDDPDDLIAELTKLMASDIGTGSTGTTPAGTKPPEPDRAAAPATEQPALRPSIPPQTIRIPGISQPVAASAPPATSKFDFGRAPQSAQMPASEPLANWQDRIGGSKPANPLVQAFPPTSPATRQEPTIGSGNWRPAIAPGEAEHDAAASGPAFEFDFGFNQQRPDAPPKQPVASAPKPPVAAPVPVQGKAAEPVRDPIADLIAAELDAAVSGRPTPVAVTAPEPAEVEAEIEEPDPQPAPPVLRPANLVPLAPVPKPQLAPLAVMPAVQQAPAPVRPAPQPVRPVPESDRFATAPVFGLGNRPAGEPMAPKVELDPMDEIENLIGEAVRVELNAPPPPVPVRREEPPLARAPQPQQPIVPPLNTQFAPRRTSLREPAPVSDDADEAILAAAAATGAEVGRVDSPFVDERPVRQKKQARRQQPLRQERPSGGAFKQLIVPAVAGTILVVLGFGLYWALGMGHHDGQAPVLAADATPAKTIPPKPVDTAPHSVVMDELSGNSPAPGKETLVSRDQTSGTDATQVATAAPAAADSGDGGLANRKVRTVTVRPDGSIVSSDDSVAGAAKLPVDRPNVPAVPGVASTTSAVGAPDAPDQPNAAGDAVGATAPATSGNATTTDSAAAAPAAADPVAPASDVDAADAAAAQPDPNAPIPMARSQRPQVLANADEAAPPVQATSPKPTSPVNALVRNGGSTSSKPIDLIGNLAAASESSDAAPAKPAAARPTAQAAASGNDAVAPAPVNAVAHVQLSSQQSAAGAQASAATLQKRFGSLLNGTKLQIVKADLGAKGVYYRVMVPASSLAAAQQLCASIKSNGGQCVAGNG